MKSGIGSVIEREGQIEALEGAWAKLFLVSQLDSIKADKATHRAIIESQEAMAHVSAELRAAIGNIEDGS